MVASAKVRNLVVHDRAAPRRVELPPQLARQQHRRPWAAQHHRRQGAVHHAGPGHAGDPHRLRGICDETAGRGIRGRGPEHDPPQAEHAEEGHGHGHDHTPGPQPQRQRRNAHDGGAGVGEPLMPTGWAGHARRPAGGGVSVRRSTPCPIQRPTQRPVQWPVRGPVRGAGAMAGAMAGAIAGTTVAMSGVFGVVFTGRPAAPTSIRQQVQPPAFDDRRWRQPRPGFDVGRGRGHGHERQTPRDGRRGHRGRRRLRAGAVDRVRGNGLDRDRVRRGGRCRWWISLGQRLAGERRHGVPPGGGTFGEGGRPGFDGRRRQERSDDEGREHRQPQGVPRARPTGQESARHGHEHRQGDDGQRNTPQMIRGEVRHDRPRFLRFRLPGLASSFSISVCSSAISSGESASSRTS